jgi:hypothetical protein
MLEGVFETRGIIRVLLLLCDRARVVHKTVHKTGIRKEGAVLWR